MFELTDLLKMHYVIMMQLNLEYISLNLFRTSLPKIMISAFLNEFFQVVQQNELQLYSFSNSSLATSTNFSNKANNSRQEDTFKLFFFQNWKNPLYLQAINNGTLTILEAWWRKIFWFPGGYSFLCLILQITNKLFAASGADDRGGQ